MSERNSKIKRKLKTRYRFAILDDTTHEHLYAIRGTRLQAIAVLSGSIILLCGLIYAIIAFTPVKLLLPGYPSYETQRNTIQNAAKVDSLESRMKVMTLQLTNISRIISGEEPFPIDSLLGSGKISEAEKIAHTGKYAADSIMKKVVDSVERYSLQNKSAMDQLEGMLFFTPVKGAITENYNPAIGHPYIDIAVQNGSPVRAVMDGTVITAYWSDETGYNIYLQHDNELISVYKHNTKLLKKVGDKVKAGTTISMAGDAGSLSTGPHLHFELWHKGSPISPTLYINF